MNPITLRLFNPDECSSWRESLAAFSRVDVCHLPEYHDAYRTRITGSRALLWSFEKNGERFNYPFLLSPVILQTANGRSEVTEFFDVSSIYGYSGPLSTTDDPCFLFDAWNAFDQWAHREKVICEFVRFSAYVNNHKWAHPDSIVEPNRPIAYAQLPRSSDEYFQSLGSKTRNMIRRATREGLIAKELDIRTRLEDFRVLYRKTMNRNEVPNFFIYNDEYYERLFKMPACEVILCGVYNGSQIVSAAIALVHRRYGLYHLGANDAAVSQVGAGNLALFEVAKMLIQRGVEYFNIGGGRTTDNSDPLFNFKKSNGNAIGKFLIGKRIIDHASYDRLVEHWKTIHRSEIPSQQLQFYR